MSDLENGLSHQISGMLYPRTTPLQKAEFADRDKVWVIGVRFRTEFGYADEAVFTCRGFWACWSSYPGFLDHEFNEYAPCSWNQEKGCYEGIFLAMYPYQLTVYDCMGV